MLAPAVPIANGTPTVVRFPPSHAVAECGILSLSQRCGEFRRAGHTVADKWVTLGNGKRIKSYRIQG